MEVNKPMESINSYWLKTVAKLNLVATLVGLSESLIIGATAFFVFPHNISLFLFGVGVVVLAIVLIIINSLIMYFAVRPLKDLLAITSKISNEDNTSLVPPNINSKKYKNTGFATAVSVILNDNNRHFTPNEEDCDKSNEALLDSLDRLSCKIILLDGNNHITYHNQGAPVKIAPGEEMRLDLYFNGKETFDYWLENAKNTTVNAEKVWKRVPNKITGESDKRFYDVHASYKKGSANETVITLIDRTKEYSEDEEALDFIAFAAHELRGPITVIRGYIDVLHEELSETLIDDQAELFKRLEVSANKLSSYINNILNTSRYDRRHLKIRLEKDTYANIYKGIADDMQLRASSQGRLLEVIFQPDLPKIAADRNSISEVMSNLIDNAVKYSNDGGLVSVTTKLNGDFVEFIVKDRGIGMPENVVSNLFQKFYRSHRSRETVAGTGIGLYISKAIVESHGGNISVISEEGTGSTFTVSLPTYDSIAEKLNTSDENEGVIKEGGGWIKNHGMYRG